MNNQLDLNKLFNGLNVRILGTNEYPIFYGYEILDALGLGKSNHQSKYYGKLSDKDIVSLQKLEELNITPCVICSNGQRKSSKRLCMLTEHGVLKLIKMSSTQLSDALEDWINSVMTELRVNKSYEITILTEKLRIQTNRVQELEFLNNVLKAAVDTKADKLYIFEIKNNRRSTKQTFIPTNEREDNYYNTAEEMSDYSDSEDDDDNSDNERSISGLFRDDCELCDILTGQDREVHIDEDHKSLRKKRTLGEKIELAYRTEEDIDYICEYSYKLTTKPSSYDLMNFKLKGYAFVTNLTKLFQTLDSYLNRIDRTYEDIYYYNCTIEELNKYIKDIVLCDIEL
jgi:prophage antirepressor-like protein